MDLQVATEDRELIATAIRKALATAGYDEADRGDREVVIGPVEDGRCAVWDRSAKDRDALGVAISRAGARALGMRIRDHRAVFRSYEAGVAKDVDRSELATVGWKDLREDPSEGCIRLRFASPPRAPLHAIDDPRLPTVLGAMREPQLRFVLVPLVGDLPDAVEIFRRWHESTSLGIGTLSTWSGTLSTRPRTAKFDGTQWSGVARAIERSDLVSLHTGGQDTGSGFVLSRAPMGGDALHLGMWFHPRRAPNVAAARAELDAIADRLMKRGAAYQAVSAEWRWAPRSFKATATPYEVACGVRGGCTTHAWCARWLRAVGDRIWIGPELRTHLDDERALVEGADVVDRDGFLKVYVRDVEAVERALAPILPRGRELAPRTGPPGLGV